jgi:hypothetical protein
LAEWKEWRERGEGRQVLYAANERSRGDGKPIGGARGPMRARGELPERAMARNRGSVAVQLFTTLNNRTANRPPFSAFFDAVFCGKLANQRANHSPGLIAPGPHHLPGPPCKPNWPGFHDRSRGWRQPQARSFRNCGFPFLNSQIPLFVPSYNQTTQNGSNSSAAQCPSGGLFSCWPLLCKIRPPISSLPLVSF